ncbi:MAG: hypothetical protein ACRD12_08570, partial [Acidimicrobiales bacterium]
MEAMTSLAGQRSLSETYNVAWQAARAAADAAQQNPRAPRANMTTHAVNIFESRAQGFVANPERTLRRFSEIPDLPLSALTRTLFLRIFGADPMVTSVPMLDALLGTPISETLDVGADGAGEAAIPTSEDERDPGPAETLRMLQWLEKSRGPLVTSALVDLLRNDPDVAGVVGDIKPLVSAWRYLGQMLDALLELTRDEHGAALAVVAAAGLAQGTVERTDPFEERETFDEPVSVLLTSVLTDALIPLPEDE